MKVLNFVRDYFRREPGTSWMLVVLACAIAVSAATHFHFGSAESLAPAPSPSGHVEEAGSEADVEAEAKAKIEALQKNPELMLRIGLALALVLALGLAVDVIFVLSIGPGFWRAGPHPDSPWGAGAVFKGFVFLFFAEVAVSVFGGIVLGLMPALPYDENVFLMATTFFRNGATALYVLVLVRKRYSAPPSELGIKSEGWAKHAAAGAAAYVGFFPVYFVILLALMGVLKIAGWEPPMQNVVEMVYKEDNAKTLIAFGLFIAFVGPLFEELFFRGFVYRGFRRRWGMKSAIVVTSVLFAVMHAHWVALAPIFALSALLCFLYEKSGSIVPGAVLHMVHNVVTLGMMFGLKAFDAP